MKKISVHKNVHTKETDWLSKVIIESTRDPRLSKKTPRKNRVWILIIDHRIQGIGLALTLKKRHSLSSRIIKKLNPKIAFQELQYYKESPVCGFYDDFEDSISLNKLSKQIHLTISTEFEKFWKTDLGKKIQSGKSLSDSVTLFMRRLQAL